MTKIILLILLTLSSISFYKINELNYKKAITIKRNIIKHPESLPTKEVAKNTSFWFANLKADLYWLETIQYIWWNAISSEYKKYLFSILDIVTELNPYFEHPYIIGQLLLPSYNHRYEKLSKNKKDIYTEQAIQLWKKWIKNFCTATFKNKDLSETLKIELIKKEFNLNKIWTEEKYKNPCKGFQISDKLAYIYYFYKKDWITASNYYKITSANEDSLDWAKVMAAIMQWKWGNRFKSFFMFLNMATNSWENNEACKLYFKIISSAIKGKELTNNYKEIKYIEEARKKIFLEKKGKINWLEATSCENFLNKATRELNLNYIQNAYNKYILNWDNEEVNTPEELFDKKYIDFIPTDYQQEKNQWIIYFYDDELKHFDYKMGYNQKN